MKSPTRRQEGAQPDRAKTTFHYLRLAASLFLVSKWQGEHGVRTSLRELRDSQDADQTLQNLLRALTLNLELRARYRVFEFEATQDGHDETAQLFRELRESAGDQISGLMSGLRERLGQDAPSTEGIA